MERLNECLAGSDCLNSSGACSWTKRLWTLQEFVYSTSCSFLFANQEVVECCKLEDINNSPSGKLRQLNDYSCRLYEDCVEYPRLSTEEVQLFLARENLSTYTRLRFNVMCVQTTTVQDLQDNSDRLASLLLGDVQVWDVASYAPDSAVPLLKTLLTIREESRTATQAADYILSVFSSPGGIHSTQNSNHLTPTELLEDALAQLHNLSDFFVPSYSPAGLSGSIFCSAQWSPGISRAATEVKDSTDIFSSFRRGECVIVRSPARLPLRLQSTHNTTSLGRNAQNFGSWIREMNVNKTITYFTVMVVRQLEPYLRRGIRLEWRFEMSVDDGIAKLNSSSESDRVAALLRLMSWVSSDPVQHNT